MVWVALAALLSNLCKFSTNFLIFCFSAGPNLLAQAGTAHATNSVTMNSKHIGVSKPAWLIGLQKAVGNLAAAHSVTHSNSEFLSKLFFFHKKACELRISRSHFSGSKYSQFPAVHVCQSTGWLC